MTSFTPGPLSVEATPFGDNDYKTAVVIPSKVGFPGQVVADCHHDWTAPAGQRRISWAEAEANARLYAAAPELFYVLNEMLRWKAFTHPDMADAFSRADRAVAKAKGTTA